ncbi:putative nucleotidyltransferase [Xenococcus sp. PCC 7305]|uniref:nucleotidyltransferase family protein n=1 Tax=Xenococcus sp. PCC 7305 TaxID=102125 RepID=UPI0002ACA368|nr:nucleotidyltransferase family protein [Xenococcus sp. PCC 7305]ELS02838.1 putative nucleotidyltransferase [Xenococcus sp. PCC 7305]
MSSKNHKNIGLGIADLLADKRAEILEIAAQHGAYNVRVFGSVARGEANINSDIDFLVDFKPKCTLLDQIALIQSLAQLLNCKVDLTEPSSLHECIRDRVLKEAIFL